MNAVVLSLKPGLRRLDYIRVAASAAIVRHVLVRNIFWRPDPMVWPVPRERVARVCGSWRSRICRAPTRSLFWKKAELLTESTGFLAID